MHLSSIVIIIIIKYLYQITAQDDNSCSSNPSALITIITPCSRQRKKDNLKEIAHSMKWDCIRNWIIVYDTFKIQDIETKFKDNEKVREIFVNKRLEQKTKHITGGCIQRNAALNRVTSGLVYFLDDDSIMHPRFWKLLAGGNFSSGITTFDQFRSHNNNSMTLKGDNPKQGGIDTSQFVIDRELIGEQRWTVDLDNGDGLFIEKIISNHKDKHVYLPVVAAYYNTIA